MTCLSIPTFFTDGYMDQKNHYRIPVCNLPYSNEIEVVVTVNKDYSNPKMWLYFDDDIINDRQDSYKNSAVSIVQMNHCEYPYYDRINFNNNYGRLSENTLIIWASGDNYADTIPLSSIDITYRSACIFYKNSIEILENMINNKINPSAHIYVINFDASKYSDYNLQIYTRSPYHDKIKKIHIVNFLNNEIFVKDGQMILRYST